MTMNPFGKVRNDAYIQILPAIVNSLLLSFFFLSDSHDWFVVKRLVDSLSNPL